MGRKHTSYDDVLAQAVALDDDAHYKYTVVVLDKDDTAVNPASTKRVLYGPGVVIYSVTAMSVDAYEYDSVETLTEDARRIYDAVLATRTTA